MKNINKKLFLKKISYLMILFFLLPIVPINVSAITETNENIEKSVDVNSSTISINKVTPDAKAISGVADGASSVDIYIDDKKLDGSKVNSDGSFKVSIPFFIKESKNIKVVSRDSLGFIIGSKTTSISNISEPKIISLADEESFNITIGGNPNIGYLVGQADPNCIIEFNFTFDNEIGYKATTTSDEEGLFYINYDFMNGYDVSIVSKDIENTQSKTLNLTSDEWKSLTENRDNYILIDEIGFGASKDFTGLTGREIVESGYTITAYDEENNIIAERIAKPNNGLYAFDGIQYDDSAKMPLAAQRNSSIRIVLKTKGEIKYDKTGIWPTDFNGELLENGMGLMYTQESRLRDYNMIKQWSKYFFVNKLYNKNNISYEDWLKKEETPLPLPISMELEYPKQLDLNNDKYTPESFEIKLKVNNTTNYYFEKMAFSFNLPYGLIPNEEKLLNQEIYKILPWEQREISLPVKFKDKHGTKFDRNITFDVKYDIEEFASGYDKSPIKGSILVKGNPNSKVDDNYEPENNMPQNAVKIDGETDFKANSKISYSGDVDWFKVNVLSPLTLRVDLNLPKEINSNYNIELYDESLNKLTFDISQYYEKKVFYTVKDTSISEDNPKVFYIKILGSTDKDFNTEKEYQLNVSGITQESGSELKGWDYFGAKYPVKDNPIVLYFDKSTKKLLSSEYETYAGESIKSIVEQGISKWNYEDKANNKPTTIIKIDENNSTGKAFPVKILNKGLKNPMSAIAYCQVLHNSVTGISKSIEVQINHDEFSKYDSSRINELKGVIAHELGHALGFKDLYADDKEKYGVDNRDKIMFGRGKFINGGEIHPIEKDALAIIQDFKSSENYMGNNKGVNSYLSASYPYYDNDTLHSQAVKIVKGKVISKENVHEEDSIPQTKLQFKVDEYYKDLIKDNKDVITVYQDGNTDTPVLSNGLLKEGDEAILYLASNSPDKYYILGGPQGKFNLTLVDSEYSVLSEIDTQLHSEISSNNGDVSKIVPVKLEKFEENIEEALVKLPPKISADFSEEANKNGWFNKDVTVSFEATDELHGIKEVTEDITITSEGENQSVTGTATNNKDVSASITIDNINIDKTKPTIDLTIPSELKENDVLKLDFKVGDILSGIDRDTLKIKLNDAEYNFGDEVVLSKGKYTLEVEVMDLAGNIAKESIKFKVKDNLKPIEPEEPEKPEEPKVTDPEQPESTDPEITEPDQNTPGNSENNGGTSENPNKDNEENNSSNNNVNTGSNNNSENNNIATNNSNSNIDNNTDNGSINGDTNSSTNISSNNIDQNSNTKVENDENNTSSKLDSDEKQKVYPIVILILVFVGAVTTFITIRNRKN